MNNTSVRDDDVQIERPSHDLKFEAVRIPRKWLPKLETVRRKLGYKYKSEVLRRAVKDLLIKEGALDG